MTNVTILIKRLSNGIDTPLPTYQSESAAGMDIHAAIDEDLVLDSGKTVAVPCGFAVAIPEGYEGQIRPRSGLAEKYGISIPNSPGTIDSDYRGEIKVLLINFGNEKFRITKGMRIAQMLILPIPRIEWHEVKELPSTIRGIGGFGHTGK
jgi:dUTP pyrophosphatase